jgi:hypothetical protein
MTYERDAELYQYLQERKAMWEFNLEGRGRE